MANEPNIKSKMYGVFETREVIKKAIDDCKAKKEEAELMLDLIEKSEHKDKFSEDTINSYKDSIKYYEEYGKMLEGKLVNCNLLIGMFSKQETKKDKEVSAMTDLIVSLVFDILNVQTHEEPEEPTEDEEKLEIVIPAKKEEE